MNYKFFDKSLKVVVFSTLQNEQLAVELHKPINNTLQI